MDTEIPTDQEAALAIAAAYSMIAFSRSVEEPVGPKTDPTTWRFSARWWGLSTNYERPRPSHIR
ncbi:MAG: hypothetical protein HKL81_01115 [Acidimicrobiaceae bacterium]|nr:hypothetical protein [Acidimicrobiaceae bacterium]